MKTESMDSKLVKFLEGRRVGKNELYTHTSLINPKGKFFIDPDNQNKLWRLQSKVLQRGGISGLAEKTDEVCPVLVDFDFRFELDQGTKRRYTDTQLLNIVSAYQQILLDIFEDIKNEDLVCVVLQREKPYSWQGKIKDGFHLHFPFVSSEVWVQKTAIREQIIRKIVEDDLLSGINFTNKLDDVIDKNIPPGTWLMYGSQKDPKIKPYLVTKVIDGNGDETNIREGIINRIISELDFNEDEEQRRFTKSPEFYLPYLLSIRNREGYQFQPKSDITKKESRPRRAREIISKKTKDEIDADMELARELCNMLSEDRFDDYMPWLELGWCLFNISQGSDVGLILWIDLSKKSKKFEDGICEEWWDKMTLRNLGLGTLRYWVKNDDPDGYIKWTEKQLDKHAFRAIKGAPYDVAKVIYAKYQGEFVCGAIKEKMIYHFRNHRWHLTDSGVELSRTFSTDIVKVFSRIYNQVSTQMMNADDPSKQQELNSQMQDIGKTIAKLKNTSYKASIMKECMELFYDDAFLNKLDTNVNLLCFSNGVYDLENDYFREGRPDDYISLCTNIEYSDFDWDDDEVAEAQTFLDKIFTNKRIRRHFVRDACSFLRGGNINKRFRVWTGDGNNGKSITSDILFALFGSYAIKLPTSLVTGKRLQAGSACPELARSNGTRLAVLQEPDGTETMNIGIIKELTGGDSFYVRTLFSKGGDITPMFKLVLMCNKMPKIPADDNATWNRVRVTPFTSEFTKDAPSDEKEQFRTAKFPEDPNFRETIPRFAPAFMWLLMQEFKQYKKDNYRLYEPEEVMAATNNYRKANDIYLQFIDECIDTDKNGKVNLGDLYAVFKDWFRDSFPSYKLPNKTELKADLVQRWGNPTYRSTWEGYKIILDETEEKPHKSKDEEYQVPL